MGDGGHAMLLVRLLADRAVLTTGVCTYQRWNTGYTLAMRTVPDHNLIYVLAGRVVWEVAGEPLELRPCQFVIVPPGVPHQAWSLTRRIRLVSLHVQAQVGGQDLFDLLRVPLRQSTRRGSRLDRYMRGAAAEFERSSDVDQRAMMPAWVRLVVLEMFRENARAGILECQAIDPTVRMMLPEMEAMLGRRVTLADLARLSGYSPQHLNRLFRRAIGVTPMKYLMRRKLEHAAAMLREDALTIRAVAASIGLDDPAYFSRLFAGHYGMSPAAYRQLHRSEAPPLVPE